MPGALRAEIQRSNIAVCGIAEAVVRELLRASSDDHLTVTMKPEVARAAFGPFEEQHQDTDEVNMAFALGFSVLLGP